MDWDLFSDVEAKVKTLYPLLRPPTETVQISLSEGSQVYHTVGGKEDTLTLRKAL